MTTEDVGLDKRNSFDGIDHIAPRVLGKMPLLRDVRILRAYAGLRPRPNDGHPVIDRSDALEGFYVAVMQSGITLSALAGQLVSEWITTGQRPADLQPYRRARFDIVQRQPNIKSSSLG